MLSIMLWSFLSGLALGVLDAVAFSPAWRWLLGGGR